MSPTEADLRTIWRRTLDELANEKGYSPTRRWLRAERARDHLEAIAPDVETVMDWRPSRAPAVEIASRRWVVPYQDVDTSTDETIFYTGHGRIE